MSARDYEHILAQNLNTIASRWGPIDWRAAVASFEPQPDDKLAELFAVLSDIEEVSFYMQAPIRRLGVTKLTTIQEFNAIWLAEEAEHARALAALALKYGAPAMRLRKRHTLLYRVSELAINVPGFAIGRMFPRGLLALYLTIGTLQEYVALTTYRAISETISDQVTKDILRQIARQEGRHMRFYRKSAEAVLAGSPLSQVFARLVLRFTWQPPGVGLLGFDRWVQIFGRFISTPADQERLARLDDLASELPGIQGISVMRNLLERYELYRRVGPQELTRDAIKEDAEPVQRVKQRSSGGDWRTRDRAR